MCAAMTPVVEARAVSSGEDSPSRLAKLQATCASRRAELEVAEAELARHRAQIAEYIIPDEDELSALIRSIEEDVEAHVASDKPYVRKLALAIGSRSKAEQALAIAEEVARDVDLTPGQLKAEMRLRLDEQERTSAEMRLRLEEQERTFACERDALRAENASLHERLDVLEAIVGMGNISVASDVMFRAVDQGNISVARFFLTNGVVAIDCGGKHSFFDGSAWIDSSASNTTLLHHAAWKGDVAMAEFLLDKGSMPHLELSAVVRAKGSYKQPCCPIELNWPDNKDLIREYPSVNESNGRHCLQLAPLQLAAYAASLPMAELLLARGAKTHGHQFRVPNGADGDLVANFLYGAGGAGSKPAITRV